MYQTTTKVIRNIQTVMILSVGGWYQIVRTPTSSSIIGMSTSTTNANNISPKKVHLLSIQLFSNFLLSSFLNNNKKSFVISSKISRIISHYLLKKTIIHLNYFLRVFYFHKTTVILLTRKVYRTKLILAKYSYTYVVYLLDQLIY